MSLEGKANVLVGLDMDEREGAENIAVWPVVDDVSISELKIVDSEVVSDPVRLPIPLVLTRCD